MVDEWDFLVFGIDLDDIKSPRQLSCAEAFEPCVRTALDEFLFLFRDCVVRSDFGIFPAGFHFHKSERAILVGDDIDLAATWGFKVFG